MASDELRLVAPGDVLGEVAAYGVLGEGVYAHAGKVRAALVGSVSVTGSPSTISVVRPDSKPTLVPQQGSVVLAKVSKVTPRFAKVSILCVNDVPLKSEFPGMIRQADVRLTNVDQVEIYKCFRPGDIVRAEVISLGDKNSYYLSTAKNEYGVIFATSMAGAVMVPVSWESMMCPKTKMTEQRKVAKV